MIDNWKVTCSRCGMEIPEGEISWRFKNGNRICWRHMTIKQREQLYRNTQDALNELMNGDSNNESQPRG